ncbi:MAG TPA: hypothetical protein VM243_13400 [Phycisphaerae bacterium]|nr:hypothetical protein [Phycisphaerae bacterium]
MTRQRRNWILLWIIILGLANFVSYTVMYWYLQGDAKNGAFTEGNYYVRGHFIHGTLGQESQVGRGTWLYSFVHSISIWPTVGAVLIAMFILARPHIIATMGTDTWMSGRTFITVCITVIVLITGASTLYFILSFANALVIIGRGESWGV